MRAVVFALSLLVATTSSAADDREARALYDAGQTAFKAGQYQEALDAFKRGYLASRSPAFLFNMASALEKLQRPHDAAEELRAFLRASGTTEDHADIEGRVRALDEEQRILDAERLKNEPARLVEPPPQPRWTHRKTVITAVAVTAGVLVIGGLGVGLGLGLHRDYASSTLGTHPATP